MWAARTRNFKEAWDVDYDAIVVPGGVWSSTVVRNDGDAIALIQSQYKKGKLLATTCSGSTVLINAGIAKGKSLTGSPSITIDLVNAGALYQDVPTVTDGNLVSGRSPGGKDNQLWIIAMADFLSKH
jgi:protease I